MKLLSILFVSAFLGSSLMAAPVRVKTKCHCENCQCTPEDHCGCYSDEGCKCNGDPSTMTKEQKRQCQKCNGGNAQRKANSAH